MKLLALYRPDSDHARVVEGYIQEFQHLHPDKEVELVNVDSVKGAEIVELYDAVDYPALLVISTDGQLLNMWSGESLPLMDNVLGYLKT